MVSSDPQTVHCNKISKEVLCNLFFLLEIEDSNQINFIGQTLTLYRFRNFSFRVIYNNE